MSAHPHASTHRPRLRYVGRSSTDSHARPGEALRGAIRWLNPRAPDVVRIQRTSSPPGSGDATVGSRSIRRQVARWRGRVRRARAAVVLRRYLALALGLAVLGEVIARLVSSEARPPWAFVGVAVALAGAAVALAAPIKDATVAEMLDRGLGLFDRIGTALELEAQTKGSPALAARVVVEAQGALGSSFGTARARPRPAPREWGALLALALLLALLVALPKFGHAQSSRASLAHHPAGSTVGKVQHRGSASRRLHRRHHVSLPVGAGVDNNFSQPPLALSPSSPQLGKGLGTSIYGHGARSTGKYQLGQTGLSETAGSRMIAAPGSGSGKPGSNGAGPTGSHSPGSAGAKPSGGASRGGRLSAPGTSSGNSPGGSHAGGRGTGAPAAHGGQAANGGSQSRQSRPQPAPPGGENAGASRGSTRLGPALAPDVGTGHAGLPLQAGFAPSAARKAGHGGISQTPNGGGGRARSQNAGGAEGSGSAQSGATPIQPTPNTGAGSTQSLVSSYFGGANQLRPGSW